MARMRCLPSLAAAVAYCLLLTTALSAQTLVVPSSQYGAISFPEIDAVQECGVSIDRFTDSTKASDYVGPDSLTRTRKYALRRTIGFNSVFCTIPRRFRTLGLLAHVSLLVGVTRNDPSRYLQNDFLHRRSGLDSVHYNPDHVYKSAVAAIGVDVNRWYDVALRRTATTSIVAPLFLGGGAVASNVTNEIFLQAGVRSGRWRIREVDVPSLSAMFRSAVLVRPGRPFGVTGYKNADVLSRKVYPNDAISRTYTLNSVSVRVPVDRWFRRNGVVPEIEYAVTGSDFFRLLPRTSTEKIDSAAGKELRSRERLCSIALRWAGGDFTIETYNDSCGSKDQGPSYGVRLFVRRRPGEGKKS